MKSELKRLAIQRAEGQSRLNDGLGLLPKIEAHIRQLSPHMMQRDGVVLLSESRDEIEKLRTALRLVMS